MSERSYSKDEKQYGGPGATVVDETTEAGELINASGHVQELSRNFSLLSAAATGITVGNVWAAFAGSILTSLFNGGPPGMLYEFITVSIFYWTVAASIAELASAIPSSGGVYHWASVTGGKRYGRIVGFMAGYWNYFAWVLGVASMSFIFSNTIVQMYAFKHTDFTPQPWHVFVTYLISTWIACLVVCFGNRALPYLNQIGMIFIVAGFIITVVVAAVMPGLDGHAGYASSSFVWKEWQADLGYPNGFVFVAGMLNGAYSVGVPDAVSHLAEEIPYPQKNVPIAILMQTVFGSISGLCFLIAILYGINDYDALFNSPFPIADIYHQITGSAAGTIGLLCLILFCVAFTMLGAYIDAGRMLWALGRDGATPFPGLLGSVNRRLDMPFNATILSGILVTVLGCIYVGSSTAFNAFVGSFVLMSSSSYIAAILPHLLTGRRNISYGPFKLPGLLGPILNAIACGYMIVWFVIYCFPFYLPVDAKSMNYASLIWGGLTIFVGIWWVFAARRDYVGPKTTGGVFEAELAVSEGNKKA